MDSFNPPPHVRSGGLTKCATCRNGDPFSIDLASLHKTQETCHFCHILFRGIVFHQDFHFYNPLNQKVVYSVTSKSETSSHPPMKYSTTPIHIKKMDGYFSASWSPWYENPPKEGVAFDLEFYTDLVSGQQMGRGPKSRSRIIAKEALSEPCLALIKGWIGGCRETHKSCRPLQPSELPKRYLEISNSEAHKYPSIRLCDDDTAKTGNFAALSHVWKASKPMQTTKDNICSMIRGISYTDMPLTFQQAIKICLALDLKYLWIDSLCIIQDDNEDWQAQASKMGSIYSSSFLTIAAHPTEDMRGGMDAEADNGCHLSRTKTICEIDALDNTFSVFCRKTHDHEQFVGRSVKEGASTYFKRAWCFQERLLAPRILHFMQPEVIFECNSGLECECGQATYYAKSGLKLIHFQLKPRFEKVRRGLETQEECWKTYNRLIQNYAEKRLTFPKDVLPALSSTAALLSPFLGKYFAGIWEFHLIHGLQWRSDWVRLDERNECHRHLHYVAPSFSWASRHGGVSWDLINGWTDDASDHDCAVIHHIECKPRGSDIFGQVKCGSLTLSVNKVPMEYVGQDEALWWKINLTGVGIDRCSFDLDAKEDLGLAKEKDIFCLEIMRKRKTGQIHHSVDDDSVDGDSVDDDSVDDDSVDDDSVDGNSAGCYVRAIVAVLSNNDAGTYQRIGLANYTSSASLNDLNSSRVTIV